MNTTTKTPEQVKTEKAFTDLTKKIDLLNQCVNECEGSELDRMSEEIVEEICDCMDSFVDSVRGRKMFKIRVMRFKDEFGKFSKKIKTLIEFTFGTEGSERESGIGRYARSVKRAVPSMRDCLIDCEIM